MKAYKKTNGDSNEDFIFLTNEDNFKKVNLCDTHDRFGQTCGCANAGCYSLDNTEGDACIRHLEAHIEAKFSIEFSYSDYKDGEYDEESFFGELKPEIESWAEANVMHTEVTAWNYWNGNNHQTIVLKCDFGEPDCEEIDEEENEAIIEDYENNIDWKDWHFGQRSGIGNKYIFYQSQFANDPYSARVVKIDFDSLKEYLDEETLFVDYDEKHYDDENEFDYGVYYISNQGVDGEEYKEFTGFVERNGEIVKQ